MRVTEGATPEQRAAEILSEQPSPAVNPQSPSTPSPAKRGRGRPPGSKTRSRSSRPTARVNGHDVVIERPPSPEEIRQQQEQLLAEAAEVSPAIQQLVGMLVDPYLPPQQPYSIEQAQGIAVAAIPVMRKHEDALGPNREEWMLGLAVLVQGVAIYKAIKDYQRQQAEQQPA